MRINVSLCATFILSCFAVSTSSGQQSTIVDPAAANKVYPWHIQDTNAAAVPAAPASSSNGVSFRLLDALSRQDQDDSASVGDQVPQAPRTDNSTNQVPLSVQSNAISESDNYFGPACSWCQLGEVQRIIGTGPRGTSVGGFAQAGYHSRNIAPLNYYEDDINIHQLWLYVDRKACRGPNWAMGYRIDAVYGTDAQDIQAIGNPPPGNPSGWDNSLDHGRYGWAIPQAYVSFARADTEVRAGYFLSPFGYESVPSTENFFYSRTYARYYSHPWTHTGVIMQREVNCNLTTLAGFTLGWDTAFDRSEGGFNFLGGFRYQLSPHVRVGLNSSLGDTGYRGSGTVQNAFAELQLTDRVQYVAEATALNLQGNDEVGFSNYLFYCVNPCLGFGTRLEWWKGDRQFGTSRSTYDWTLGANIRPHANFVIRPEVRLDWGALANTPGDAIYGVDAIILF